MIEITPAILGPGIEEEYADALDAIHEIQAALGTRSLTNNTPDGRLLLEVADLEQEIRAGRLPIAVDPSYIGTINYLIGSNELNHVRGLREPLGRLYLVVNGIGLMKPRHLPVLLAMIDDLLADAANCVKLENDERAGLADMGRLAQALREGARWPIPRSPQQYPFTFADTPNLDECVENFFARNAWIEESLFEGWRPYPARKPRLAPPTPGLPERAPPLPEALVGRLP